MGLFIRLIRALRIFGVIFISYMVQLGLVWVLRKPTPEDDFEVPAWLVARRERVDARNARRMLRGMLRLRGVYIKLGQVLSIIGGFLPPVYGKELEVLQDHVPPHPFRDVKRALIEGLGKGPEALFVSMARAPIASASLGQVHEAELHDGRKVAVKVLYPGIRGIIETDLKVIRLSLRVYNWFVPVQNMKAVYDALVDLLDRETNYLHEAACMRRMGENFAHEPDIVVPEVIDELTSRDVLTMTFMEGFKVNDVAEMAARGIDPNHVATRLIQSFYEQLFVHRFFHADPHPGNFLLSGEGEDVRLIVLDFGAISEVPDHLLDGLLDVLRGVFTKDDALVLSGFYDMGFVAESGNRALVERTVKTYFTKLLKVEDRSAGALMRASTKDLQALVNPEVQRRELRELMRSVHYPEGWFLVERAVVLMFWLLAQIDPTVDSMKIGVPYIMPRLMKRIAASKATSDGESATRGSEENSGPRSKLDAGGAPSPRSVQANLKGAAS